MLKHMYLNLFSILVYIIWPEKGSVTFLKCVTLLRCGPAGGVDCDNILDAAHTLTMTSKAEGRERKLTLITNQMHRFLASRMKNFVGGFHCNIQHIMKLIFKPCGRRYWTSSLHVPHTVYI